MPWIESHTVLIRHKKLREFARELRIRPSYAMGHLHALWHAALEQREDGNLSEWSDEFIADVSDFPGDAPQYVRLLQKHGWLDNKLLHDWLDYVGAYLTRKYKTSNRQRLVDIWRLHGRQYGGSEEEVERKTTPDNPPLPTYQGGGNAPARFEEIPTEQEALDQTATAGIPSDFARYVFQDWSSRQGKDAAGNLVKWLHYVTKRWAREQVEWRAGMHKGKRAVPSAARVGPTLAEVRALLIEKHGRTPETENWAVSFYGHWNDPKRNWSRKGRPIDWKVELSQQTAKWKAAKQVTV